MANITEVEAINVMLNAIGEQGIDYISEVDDYEEAKMAQIILGQTITKVLSQGYNFNLLTQYELLQDINGEIALPLNVINIKFSDKKYIKRGDKVYNTTDHTFNIGEDLKADIYEELFFTDIPYVAQEYINLKAATIFQQRVLGSSEKYQITKRDELEAKENLIEYDMEIEEYNVLNTLNISNRRK